MFRSTYWRALLVAGSILYPCAAAAAEPRVPGPDASLEQLALGIQRVTLENGLRVIMNREVSAPTVALCVVYDVGSRNEAEGRTGFAHLFEHMMFQGSKNLDKGDHFKLIAAHGGTLNGTTSGDRTNYYEVLPAGSLELGLWLEADRMKSLQVTQENFENQRRVVQEEYRMRVSNAPYAQGLIALKASVFEGYFPYAHDAIGSMADLDDAKLEWIQEFHRSYYAPNNAVLVIAGDFDPDLAMRYVRQYFSDAKPSSVPRYEPPTFPEQTAERRAEVLDHNARTPAVYYGFALPPFRDSEHYALELASMVLGFGETSRLHQRLVRETGLAREASAWTHDHRGPDMFALRAVLSEKSDLGKVERIIDEEIERLGSQGPSAGDLTKAKNRLKHYFLFGLEGNIERAQQLGNYELFWGDARLLTRELDNYLAVTPARVKAASQRYLRKARRNYVYVRPAEQASR